MMCKHIRHGSLAYAVLTVPDNVETHVPVPHLISYQLKITSRVRKVTCNLLNKKLVEVSSQLQDNGKKGIRL
jgi:hypothetical protein